MKSSLLSYRLIRQQSEPPKDQSSFSRLQSWSSTPNRNIKEDYQDKKTPRPIKWLVNEENTGWNRKSMKSCFNPIQWITTIGNTILQHRGEIEKNSKLRITNWKSSKILKKLMLENSTPIRKDNTKSKL